MFSDDPPANDTEGTSESHTVSILELFRFSSKFEICLNVLGAIAAVACGSATPFMSILFGNLISSFVAIGQLHSGSNLTQEGLHEIALTFRHNAKMDALKLVYLGIGTFSAAFVCRSFWTYTSESISKRLRSQYFRAIIHQDLSFYDDVTAGEVATCIEVDTRLVQQGISEKFAFIASYSSSFVTGLSIAYVKSWRLSLALSAMLPCIILVGTGIGIFGSRYSRNSMASLSKASGILQETLSTIRIVHAFGAEGKLLDVFAYFINQTRASDIRFSGVLGIGMAIFSFIVYCSYSLSFYFGTTLLLQGHGDAGTVVTVGLAILIGSFSCLVVGPNIEAVMHARSAAYRLYKVIDRTPLINSKSHAGIRVSSVHGDVVFKDVSFKYPSRPDVPALTGVSLVFPAFKTSALVGLSGSGKSTIVSLIERLYDVNAGEILIDGVDIRHLHIKSLRSNIGLVSQEPLLFSGSIRDNIAMGLLGTPHESLPPDEQLRLVKEACVKAHVDAFVTRLPQKYDTLVGNDGIRLSGGQRQRIAIARAVVSNPSILLLDEATSALDTESEKTVQAALAEASRGRTTIIIAHRLSTIKNADIIYVMDHGHVTECGTHHSLLENPSSRYCQLVSVQNIRHTTTIDMDSIVHNKGFNHSGDKSEHNYEEKPSQSLEMLRQPMNPSETTTYKDGTITLIRDVGRLVPETFGMYAWGTFFGIIGGLVYPAHGIVYARALHAFESVDRRVLRDAGSQNALWLFVIAIGSTVSLGFHNVLFGKAAMILTARLRLISFKSVLKKDVAFFDRDENNPGALTAGLVGGPEKIKGFTSLTLGAIIQCISCCVSGSIISLVFGWKLGLVGIACIPPIVGAGFLRLQLVSQKERSTRNAYSKSAQLATEAVSAIRTVASLTCEDYLSASYYETLYRPQSTYTMMANIVGDAIFAFSLSAIFLAVGLVFWYGSGLVASGEYSTFRFYVSFMTTVFSSWNAANVFLSVPDISSATDAAREIMSLIKTSRENSLPGSEKKFETFEGKVTLKNVSFRYPSRPEVLVLESLSVEAQKGSYIAFVGPSGSGKSTIIQIIERFYEPLSGSVYLDDKPITRLDTNWYRQNIAFVSQDTKLYSGTIRFNITLGSIRPADDISEDEIREACRLANILEFIEELPQGFETEVGERGSQLSGGQKQRIAIARALIRKPKILLLDEATSALDANSEAAVQKALANASKGRTTIAIAHRLSTIQHADCIYFIQGGKVTEYGTHSQLILLGGHYAAYERLQQLTPS